MIKVFLEKKKSTKEVDRFIYKESLTELMMGNGKRKEAQTERAKKMGRETRREK